MKEIPLLTESDIECKVKAVSEKGCTVLLYKNARVDMAILDEVFGPTNWTDAYSEIKGNLFCTVSVWDDVKKQWISKTDCGVESRKDEQGNEKKGEASDAFKRACFKLGIGRELYTSPFIFIRCDTVPDGQRWKLKNPFEKFSVSSIGYSERRITGLEIVDRNGEVVYSMNAKTPKPADKKPAPDKKPAQNVTITEQQLETLFVAAAKKGYDSLRISAIVEKQTGIPIDKLPPERFSGVLTQINAMKPREGAQSA